MQADPDFRITISGLAPEYLNVFKRGGTNNRHRDQVTQFGINSGHHECSDQEFQVNKILIIEPACTGNVHLSFNLGLLRTVATAYPDAEIVCIGDREQQALMLPLLDNGVLNRCAFRPWQTYRDLDTTPSHVAARLYRLLAAGRSDLFRADLIVMSAIAATCLRALQLLPRPSTQTLQLFFHGNLNDLSGWRSRNPLRRTSDFFSNIKRAAASHTQMIVLEKHVHRSAVEAHPWLKNSLHSMPLPQLSEEVLKTRKSLTTPIKVGFAGVASPAKGFLKFLTFAKNLKTRFPGRYEFHAIGMVHPDSRSAGLDLLDTKPAADQYDRTEFLKQIDQMHFLFLWPDESYYAFAASAVFYDAVNRGIPLISPHDPKLLRTGAENMGISVATLDVAIATLAATTADEYAGYTAALNEIAIEMSEEKCVAQYLAITTDSIVGEVGC